MLREVRTFNLTLPTFSISFQCRLDLSFSTIAECLNTLGNLSKRNRDFVVRSLLKILPAVLPWLFHQVDTSDDRIRHLSLTFLHPLSAQFGLEEERFIFAAFFVEGNHYRDVLLELVASERPVALDIWSYLILVNIY